MKNLFPTLLFISLYCQSISAQDSSRIFKHELAVNMLPAYLLPSGGPLMADAVYRYSKNEKIRLRGSISFIASERFSQIITPVGNYTSETNFLRTTELRYKTLLWGAGIGIERNLVRLNNWQLYLGAEIGARYLNTFITRFEHGLNVDTGGIFLYQESHQHHYGRITTLTPVAGIRYQQGRWAFMLEAAHDIGMLYYRGVESYRFAPAQSFIRREWSGSYGSDNILNDLHIAHFLPVRSIALAYRF